jgi:squalene-hopene/tetraprenyl-beta-curcumene cyclase
MVVAAAELPDQARRTAITRAVEYLRQNQAADGSFSAQAGPGVTSLVVTAALANGIPVRDPLVARGLDYLQGFVHDDGGIYGTGSLYQNYETCLAILCFSRANGDGRFDKLLQQADGFVRKLQWDEGEGRDLSDPFYGGAGYGNHQRPDLSNTSFLVEALKASGAGPDDPALQRALVFVSRCQNEESPHNTLPFSAKHPDGGFYYTGAAGGASQAGTYADGGLRSYGSMTYAGLKSMIYAGLGPDDPRVKAATDWLRGNYSLQENPGMLAEMSQAGLYYYYHMFAKALDAWGQPTFVDEKNVAHDWRQELLQELVSRQRADGSWVNDNPRWLEGDPYLVTGYALLSLSYCQAPGRP